MFLTLDIQRTDIGGKRTHGKAMRETLRGIAAIHLRTTIGKHFKNVSETKPGGAYGYVARNPEYLERKKRLKKSTMPLVFTGRQRNNLGSTSPNSVISVTQHKATLRLPAAHAMKSQQWRELTAISEAEMRDYNMIAAKIYQYELLRKHARRTRKRIS